ncbi:MAG: glycerophosphodiester phosphodiesterase family protein [Chryseolinea sp.]
MREYILTTLFLIVCLSLPSPAQHNRESPIYLTNYIISRDANAIGYVKLKKGEIRSVELGGEHAEAFKISRDYQLSVKQNKLNPQTKWFDVVLIVSGTAGDITKTFRIVRDEFIHNKVIAHRGAWKNTGAPENSIAALKHAIDLGCEGSEFDVHMSSDSLPVINHDPAIQGTSIAKTPSSRLLTLELGNAEKLPTLESYLLAGLSQNKTKLILEIKPSELGRDASIALSGKVVSLVEKLHMEAWVDYISFDYDVCKEVITIAPYAKVSYLKGDKSPAELRADKFYGLDYHYSILEKNAGWLKESKELKLTINVWTVNERQMLENLLKQEVDFITTNEPELLLSLVK